MEENSRDPQTVEEKRDLSSTSENAENMEREKIEQKPDQKGKCCCCEILKDRKKLLIGGGILLLLVILACFLFQGSVKQSNVVLDLPLGETMKIGELETSANSAVLSDVRFSSPFDNTEGFIRKVVIADTDIRGLMDGRVTEIGLIEVHDLDAGDSKARLLKYKGLKLDFPLLMNMGENDFGKEEVVRLAKSFSLDSGEAVDLVSSDGLVTSSIKHLSSRDIAFNKAGPCIMENAVFSLFGKPVAVIGEMGFKSVEFPNAEKILDPGFLYKNANMDWVLDALDNTSLKDFFIRNLSSSIMDIEDAIQLKNLSFSAENRQKKAVLDLNFDDFRVKPQLLALLDFPGLKKIVEMSGAVKSEMEMEGDNVDLSQKISITSNSLFDLSFSGNLLFGKDGDLVDGDNVDFVLKDKGIVNSLPLETKLFAISQFNLGDFAIQNAFKAFLDKPGSTMKVKIRQRNGDLEIDAVTN